MNLSLCPPAAPQSLPSPPAEFASTCVVLPGFTPLESISARPESVTTFRFTLLRTPEFLTAFRFTLLRKWRGWWGKLWLTTASSGRPSVLTLDGHCDSRPLVQELVTSRELFRSSRCPTQVRADLGSIALPDAEHSQMAQAGKWAGKADRVRLGKSSPLGE
jgi:hypothetical protein